MDKWAVECWGDLGSTQTFKTKREATAYFNSLKKGLNKQQYTITKDSIIENDNECNAVYLVNLDG